MAAVKWKPLDSLKAIDKYRYFSEAVMRDNEKRYVSTRASDRWGDMTPTRPAQDMTDAGNTRPVSAPSRPNRFTYHSEPSMRFRWPDGVNPEPEEWPTAVLASTDPAKAEVVRYKYHSEGIMRDSWPVGLEDKRGANNVRPERRRSSSRSSRRRHRSTGDLKLRGVSIEYDLSPYHFHSEGMMRAAAGRTKPAKLPRARDQSSSRPSFVLIDGVPRPRPSALH
mmetsp:Transcript_15865/g.35326  ORF Transcript_15865/g.35326 Transcript_15865/m.35326 type:complete len:223 (+) Transcript_15865:19-687(+)